MSKQATGESLPLDIRAIVRSGHLLRTNGAALRWQWGDSAAIVIRVDGAIDGDSWRYALTLDYKWRGEPTTQHVGIVWTPCNYGGRRAWWQCPSCRRRVALLYAAGQYFACRRCYDLCYFSQLETASDRNLRRAAKIRKRLGQKDGGHLDRIPDKPKGMHWKTYARLRLDCMDAERRDFEELMRRFS